jgi:hypothetical protein
MNFYDHKKQIQEISDFLTDLNIVYTISSKSTLFNELSVFEIPFFNLELRYVDSWLYKKDYTKRFGISGIKSGYFIKLSQLNLSEGIRTIWIKDFEWGSSDNGYFRKQTVLKSYIRYATNTLLKSNTIYARDCEVVEISNKEARPFLETNCFYGYRSSSVNLALKLKKDKAGLSKGTIVFLYTFGHPFFSKTLYDIEIIRVGTLANYNIIGAASKCLKHFLMNYDAVEIGSKNVIPEKIVFIVDACHNSGNSLSQLGFEYVSWEGAGFMNYETTTGLVKSRDPTNHSKIMERMSKGEIVAVENAGSIIYKINKSEYVKRYL